MKKIAGMLVVIGLAASTTYGAMLDAGTRELSVSGQWNRDTIGGQLTIGQFVVDRLIVGIGGHGTYYDAGNDVDLRTYGGLLFTQYHIDIDAPVVPFVGLAGGVTYSKVESGSQSESDTGWYGEGQAGIKTFIANNIAIALYGYYDIADKEIFSNKDELEKKDFGLRIGMNSYF